MTQHQSKGRPVALLLLYCIAAVIGVAWLLYLAISYAATDANVTSKSELLELAGKASNESPTSAGAQADLVVLFNGFSIARRLLAINMLPLALLTLVTASSALREMRRNSASNIPRPGGF